MILTWVKSFSRTQEDRKPLFERLMADSYRQAYHMAYRFTSNRTEAEDLLQETYLRAYRFFHRYDEALPFNAWLYRIMTNVHIDSVRVSNRLRTVSMETATADGTQTWELPDEKADFESQMISESLDDTFQRGLKAMTPEFRMAVVLADLEGMSYEEIAVIMDTSVGTVRSRIHRGRKQLRSYLEQEMPNKEWVTR